MDVVSSPNALRLDLGNWVKLVPTSLRLSFPEINFLAELIVKDIDKRLKICHN